MTNAPFIALTATAPQGVKETICESVSEGTSIGISYLRQAKHFSLC